MRMRALIRKSIGHELVDDYTNMGYKYEYTHQGLSQTTLMIFKFKAKASVVSSKTVFRHCWSNDQQFLSPIVSVFSPFLVLSPAILSAIFFFFSITPSYSQPIENKILSYENYIEIVSKHHPVAMQADLESKIGDAMVLSARGNFDPVLYHQTDEKYFDDVRYYSIIQSGIRIPTRLGVQFHAGYDQSGGTYLNPEKNMPQGGLAYAGLTLPIGEGLLIDKRRAELQKAKIYQKAADWERQLMLNELVYDAAGAYWDWFVAFNVREIYKNALALATNRKDFVKRSAILGDLPFIDTTEAAIQVQNLQMNYLQAQMEFANATVFLSTYLWLDGETPLNLDTFNIPNTFEEEISFALDANLSESLNTLLAQHPKMEQVRLKIQAMQVEKRLQQNMLLPTLNLKYNAINEPIGNNPFMAINSNNFTWGIQFAMPILLRKERGDLRQTNLIMEQLTLDSGFFFNQLRYHAIANLNVWENSESMVMIYRQTVNENFVLLQGERRKFEGGESSIFMVNTREVNYINAQIKLADLISKNRKAVVASMYSLGIAGI